MMPMGEQLSFDIISKYTNFENRVLRALKNPSEAIDFLGLEPELMNDSLWRLVTQRGKLSFSRKFALYKIPSGPDLSVEHKFTHRFSGYEDFKKLKEEAREINALFLANSSGSATCFLSRYLKHIMDIFLEAGFSAHRDFLLADNAFIFRIRTVDDKLIAIGDDEREELKSAILDKISQAIDKNNYKYSQFKLEDFGLEISFVARPRLLEHAKIN